MTTDHKFAVTERYPDGTKWVHYFATQAAAEQAVELNEEAHPSRTYEIRSTR